VRSPFFEVPFVLGVLEYQVIAWRPLTVQARVWPLQISPSARSSGRRLWALMPTRSSISRAVRPGV